MGCCSSRPAAYAVPPPSDASAGSRVEPDGKAPVAGGTKDVTPPSVVSVPAAPRLPSLCAPDMPSISATSHPIPAAIDSHPDANALRKRNLHRFSEIDPSIMDEAFGPVDKDHRARVKIMKAIENSTVLLQYDSEQRHTIMENMFSRSYSKGDVLLQVGVIASYFVVLDKGEVKVTSEDGSSSILTPGEFFGDVYLMRPTESKTAVTAITDCSVWMIGAKGFHTENTKVESTITQQTIELLREIPLLKPLTHSQLHSISQSLITESFSDGDYIIRKGEVGTKFYIIKSGVAICLGENKAELRRLHSKDFFGEIALMQKIPRTIDVVASGVTECWVLKQETFDSIFGPLEKVLQDNMKRRLLDSTSILNPLRPEEREQLVSSVAILNFPSGTYIIHQGEIGDQFFIIEKGEAVCTKRMDDNSEITIRRVGEGDHFGERALYSEETRSTSVQALTDVTVLSIKRESFVKLLGGSYETLIQRNRMEDFVNSIQFFGSMKLSMAAQENLIRNSKSVTYEMGETIISKGEPPSNFFIIEDGSVESMGKTTLVLSKGNYFGEISLLSLEPQKFIVRALSKVHLLVLEQSAFFEIIQPLLYKLTDLEFVSVLGVGGFAVVRKVRTKNSKKTVFALKIVNKSKLRSENSRMAILNEKQLCSKMNHPYLTRLITTFQDNEFVYMLQEFVDSGDLRTLLLSRPHGRFLDAEACFFAAVIVQCLEHLHLKKIVYRDLKPENLMLCSNGYIKICDFGNAKEVLDRTYTVCGTPDYMAPEIWLNKGHGIPCDYWAFGVLIFEFLNGETPFEAKPGMDQSDQMYRILKGQVSYPSFFTSNSIDLIRNLLKLHPSQRLGCMKGGCNDIRSHPWFQGISFPKLMNFQFQPSFVPSDSYVNSCCDVFNELTEEEIQGVQGAMKKSEKVPWIDGF